MAANNVSISLSKIVDLTDDDAVPKLNRIFGNVAYYLSSLQSSINSIDTTVTASTSTALTSSAISSGLDADKPGL